jgi:hypothetical protein
MGSPATKPKPKVAAKPESAKSKPASPRPEPSTTSPSTRATVAPLLESVATSTAPIPSAQTAVAMSTSC